MDRHVAIVGAGLTGLTTAYELQARGFAVSVFDRQRYAGMETSYANGGQAAAADGEVWTQWSNVLTGLKGILNAGAPLVINPKPSWHKLTWFAEFMGNIGNYRVNTLETVKLALKARQMLLELAEREGLDFDLARRGVLHFYPDAASMEHARRVDRMFAEAGLSRQELSPEGITELEPALKVPTAGGFFSEHDLTGDAHAFSLDLAHVVAKRGAELRFGSEVRKVAASESGVAVTDHRRETHRYDGVVICAGVQSRALARSLGDQVNVYPVKGYSITVHLNDAESRAVAPRIGLVDDGAKVVGTRLGDHRLRVAGTAEFNGFNRDIRADRIAPLVAWCERAFPDVVTEDYVPWTGLRPMTPSMLPRVGRGARHGVFYNTGHGHLGWTLCAVTAAMVADAVEAQMPAAPVVPARAMADPGA